MVSFPALILQLDLLNGDGTRIGVEVGKYLVFRNPASVNFVGENELPGFIVDLPSRCLRKSLSETSIPSPALKLQTLLAQFSNSGSCVTPRSSVIGAYFHTKCVPAICGCYWDRRLHDAE